MSVYTYTSNNTYAPMSQRACTLIGGGDRGGDFGGDCGGGVKVVIVVVVIVVVVIVGPEQG